MQHATINGYTFPVDKEAIDQIDTMNELITLEEFLITGEEISWEEDYPAPGPHRWRTLVELTRNRMCAMTMDSHVYLRDLYLWGELEG